MDRPPGNVSRHHKYSHRDILAVTQAGTEDVEAAVASARAAFPTLAAMPIHARASILEIVSRLLRERRESLAVWIVRESGKALKFASMEVDRAVDTFRLAAQEAGNSSPMVAPLGANYCSGQVCISTQWIYVAAEVAEPFLEALLEEPRPHGRPPRRLPVPAHRTRPGATHAVRADGGDPVAAARAGTTVLGKPRLYAEALAGFLDSSRF